MSRRDPAGLLGRRSECEALDRMVARARAAHGQVLVLHGEPGIGKTALLDSLVARVQGCSILRAAGVESEMELPFAGLHQLCAPLLDRLERLPEPQAGALATAFGMASGRPPGRFLVGLAVLSLLADAAEEQPLLCVVDDVQWLDRVSRQSLAFVARRLGRDPVALVFGVRELCPESEGLAQLEVRGLSDVHARALLDSVIRGPVDERVREQIVAETRGNPLALLELPLGRTPAEVAGGFGLPHALPLAGRIEEAFVRRVQRLPAETRRLLLAAAAEHAGDVTVLWRAAERLGIDPDAVIPAREAGLIEIGARVRFRHPLVRTAVWRAAGLRELQSVHRALADVTPDPDRRAWHLAHAAAGADEAVAAELERSADRVRGRGGVAAAAAFLERAANLTPDPARRGARALAAAAAKLEAAAPETASALLTAAELGPLDGLQRARLERLRAQVAFARGGTRDAPRLLLEAARRLEPLDTGLARETYLEAFGAAIIAGRLGSDAVLRQAAEGARAAGSGGTPIDLLLDGLTVRVSEGYRAAVAPLRRALDAFDRDEDLRWLWLVSPVAHELWDDEPWHRLTSRAVTFARATGALTVLPTALMFRAGVEVHAGRFAEAAALIEEAQAITAATGSAPIAYTHLIFAAWRDPDAAQSIEGSLRDAAARGDGRAVAVAEYSSAVMHNGLGQYDAALAAAERACGYDDLGVFNWALPEAVEAGARGGHRGAAAAALRCLEERAGDAGTPWALGVLARSRALLGEGDEAEALYREAIEWLAGTRIALHLARARLVYGEWLRREGRRVDAREQLRPAHELFSDIGAVGFAERAGRELLATGETVRKRTVATRDDFTAQEAQIARLAATGQTNPEIGAQLFLSPRTVEWHLRKVFSKLGISSRRELIARQGLRGTPLEMAAR